MNYNSRRTPKAEKGYQPTQEEIERAIVEFKENNGLIKRLPDEIVPGRLLVGAKYGAYDGVIFSGFNPVSEEEIYTK